MNRCLCGCGAVDLCYEAARVAEHNTLMGMPTLVPDPDEPCQDCDDDNFATLEQDGGNAPASSVKGAHPGRFDPPPSDFDDDSAIVTKRIVVGELRSVVRSIILGR